MAYLNKTNMMYDPAHQTMFPQYGFGSWLKENAGAIGAVTGGAIGTVIAPGIGTSIGASIGGSVGGSVQKADEAKEQQAQMQQQAAQQAGQTQSQMAQPQMQYQPTFAYGGDMNMKTAGLYSTTDVPVLQKGGLIDYNGQTHEGVDGGIPVDETGNPSAISGKPTVALTEDKEVSWVTPEGETYIFSDRLGFANDAKKIMTRYEKKLGKDLDGEDRLAREAMNRELSMLMQDQETERSIMQQEDVLQQTQPTTAFAYGGKMPKASKYQYGGVMNPMPQQGMTVSPSFQYQVPMGQGVSIQSGQPQTPGEPMMMRGGGAIKIKPSKRGTFKAQASKMGLSVQAAADKILGAKEGRYSPEMRRKANFAKNFAGKRYGGAIKRNIQDYSYEAPVYAKGGMMSKYQIGGELESIPTVPGALPGIGSIVRGVASGADVVGDRNRDTSLLSPLPNIINLLGQSAQRGVLRRTRPEDIRFGRVTPQEISLANERLAAQRQADTARNVAARRISGLARTPGQALSNLGASSVGTQRALGEQLGSSFQREAFINARARQASDRQNALLASREALVNAQQEQAYRDQMRQLDPTTGLLREIGRYTTDAGKDLREQALAYQRNPNLYGIRDENIGFFRRALGQRPTRYGYRD